METVPNPQPTKFEQALAEHLLAGELPVLAVLRSQWAAAIFESRELAGVGCFLNVAIPSSAPRAEPAHFELEEYAIYAPALSRFLHHPNPAEIKQVVGELRDISRNALG